MVKAYGMVGEGVLCVPTLVNGALIIFNTIGGAGVSTLGGSVSRTFHVGDVCTTLGGAPGLFRQA